MRINPSDSTYVKRKKLELVPPQLRMVIHEKLGRGDTVDITTVDEVHSDPLMPALTELMKTRTIDLTKNENLYFAVNRRLLPLRQQLARKCFDPYRRHAQKIRKLNEENNGFSDGKQFRHIGAFPPEVYEAIQEQYTDPGERDLVVRWLLTKTPEGKEFATVGGGI